MQMDPRIAATLSPTQQKALSGAVDVVEDFLLNELTERRYAVSPPVSSSPEGSRTAAAPSMPNVPLHQ